MKKLLWLALLALPLFTQPAHAQCCIQGPHCSMPPIGICFNTCFLDFNLFAGGGQTQLGPWYQYWPYMAHFQSPPPLGASLPQANYMTLPPSFGQGQAQAQAQSGGLQYGQGKWGPVQYGYPPPTTSAPAQQAAPVPHNPVQPQAFQPVGYAYQGGVPSYWYGR